MGNLIMILVTGATGYIGNNFIRYMQNKYSLVALTRIESNTQNLRNLNCIISSYQSLDDILNLFKKYKFNGVVHFASEIKIIHTDDDINKLIESNILFSTFLLEASKQYQTKWFINAGSFWQNYNNEAYNPCNLYAATKESFETISRFYTQTSALIFTTLKLMDTYGPNDKRKKILNLWKKISLSGEQLDMSSGKQLIDLCYIKDIINAYDILINKLRAKQFFELNNNTFTLNANKQITLLELSKIFEVVSKRKLHINWGKLPYREREVMEPFKGIPLQDWTPKYTIEEGIKEMLRDEYDYSY